MDAALTGYNAEEWLSLSDAIRRAHELTHVICRRRYPGDIAPLRDELVADAVGLYAALGRFAPELALLFLGIRDGRYLGGRLGNYTDAPEQWTGAVCAAVERMGSAIASQPEAKPFDLIPALMSAAELSERLEE